ncbi:hypothetical protein [Pedobacter sp. L105]|uniref:hypothetical protein n=1 Tax=Pedobacter sp. L105 TaxID=1641871 RepID=UPI00131E94A2|nr:hypothetical protein [Pedobacter sp. L105]
MMNQEDIFKKIGQILNELSDQYQYLAQNPQELNELELELFLANADFLSDHVQIIKKINSQTVQKALPEHTDVKAENISPQPEITGYAAVDEPEYDNQGNQLIEEEPGISVHEPIDTWTEPEPLKEEEAQQQPAIPVSGASGGEGYSPSAMAEEEFLTESLEEVTEPDTMPFTAEKETDQSYSWEKEHEVVHTTPRLDDDIFKPDIEPATFEFILNEKPSSDRFEFEEKSIDEIFDRPLSKEEELIIAQKQKLREMDSLELSSAEEDEIGPEPFLVAEPAQHEPEHESITPIFEAPEEEEEPEIEEIKPEFHLETPVVSAVLPITPESEEKTAPLAYIAPIAEPAPAPLVFTPTAPAAAPVSKPVIQEELFRPIASVAPLQKEEEPATQPLPKPTLNDILSGNTPNRNFNTDTRRAPITDLKQAISLNDKMRYIKDLFNGYNLAYAEAIDLLNKMPDFKTADAFLKNNYAGKHNWADKQDTADQFYELLNQRFPLK